MIFYKFLHILSTSIYLFIVLNTLYYSNLLIPASLVVPELPPRIDRASKPSSTTQLPTSTPASSLPSRNSSILQSTGSTAGTLGRSSKDRLFGNMNKSIGDEQDDLYTTSNKLLNTLDNKKLNGTTGSDAHQTSLDRQNSTAKNGSSYDSVSSYDSYNTTQIQQVNSNSSTLQNRLGPNAPDDLKSVPPPVRNPVDPTQEIIPQPRLMADRDYSFDGSLHDPLVARNSAEKQNAVNIPQRPSNLLVDSPRKQQMMETKTDYGKYR
jgi:tight junction protein 1